MPHNPDHLNHAGAEDLGPQGARSERRTRRKSIRNGAWEDRMPRHHRTVNHPDKIGIENSQEYRKGLEVARHKPRVETGTQYPNWTMSDLREVTDGNYRFERLRHAYAKRVSIGTATQELITWLTKPRSLGSKEVIQRLRSNIWKKPWHPDIAIKAFRDIDRAYFEGFLRSKVLVYWQVDGGPARSREFGCTCSRILKDMPVADIYLNARNIFRGRDKDGERVSRLLWTIRTLRHEMIHAFFVVRCGKFHEVGQDAHGEHFDAVKNALNKRLEEELGKSFEDRD